ncbi:metallophosphoesterase [Bdellovibrionota bacterium FG-2]
MTREADMCLVVDYSKAEHTLVISDIHLSDAEKPHPSNPLWKRFKRSSYFVDESIKRFLEFMSRETSPNTELVLNGDIFDFDSVLALPKDRSMRTSWLERRRGLSAEEVKSRFKIQVILGDHPVFVEALRNFVMKGNRVVFVLGNHDLELHWPTVRQDVLDAIALPAEFSGFVRFCEWYYVSNQDTLLEHGNQYDAYCVCPNPVNPLIKKGTRAYVRMPFGNLAGRFMINGIGLMNPHADSSFIKSSFAEYMQFYYRYLMRTQPFLLWTWFWGALVTLFYSLEEGLLRSMTDPLTIGARVEDISARSNSSPKALWALRELFAHPAIFNPIKVMRELWLDRAIFLVLIFFVSFQFFSLLNVIVQVSFWWFVVPIFLLVPFFIFYARSVESELEANQTEGINVAPLSARIVRVSRVVQGHIHRILHLQVEGVEYLNTGTWSPAFHDVECTQPYGKKCFAWIRPGNTGRIGELYEWKDPGIELIPKSGASRGAT